MREHPVLIRTQLQIAVFAGGVAGALARAGLAKAMPSGPAGWHWSTFTVNVAGTAALGYFTTRLQERLPPSTYRRPLLGTGLCGALTTFSALQLEVVDLGRHGHALLGIAYLLTSVAAGLLTVYLTTALTRRVRIR